LENILAHEEQQFLGERLVDSFNFSKIVLHTETFLELVPGKKLPDPQAAMLCAVNMNQVAKQIFETGRKFQQQLTQLVTESRLTGDIDPLLERGSKAVDYFAGMLVNEIILPLQQHLSAIRHSAKAKKYLQDATRIETELTRQLGHITRTTYGDIQFCKNSDAWQQKLLPVGMASISKGKLVKGASQKESLDFFKEGKTIPQIAVMRQLTEGTIGGHLAAFVRTGEVLLEELVSADKVEKILPAIKDLDSQSLTPVKEQLGNEFSFHEIRAVFNHWLRVKELEIS
jgi:hypothetical protein